jgi:hypothetical protein
MTKLHGVNNKVPHRNLQKALFIWVNFTMSISISIFTFKWHLLNLMKEEEQEEDNNNNNNNNNYYYYYYLLEEFKKTRIQKALQ